jgi:hypothetical protein
MTAAPDDPLADVDLGAWSPPPTTPAQIDAVIDRLKIEREGTRVDGALPLIDDGVPRSPKTKWIAVGIAIGVAAAAIVSVALWPTDDADDRDRTVTDWPEPRRDGYRKLSPVERTEVKQRIADAHRIRAGGSGGTLVARGDAATSDEIKAAATELAPLLGECYEIAGVAITGERRFAADVELLGDPAVGSIVVDVALTGDDVATSPELAECVRETLLSIELAGVDETMRTTLSFSIRSILDECRNYRDNEDWTSLVVCASPCSARADCAGLVELGRREIKAAQIFEEMKSTTDLAAAITMLDRIPPDSVYHQRAQALIDARRKRDDFDFTQPMSTSCKPGDGEQAIVAARDAGRQFDWKKMSEHAARASKCGMGKTARQLELMAACKLDDKATARKLYPEFETISAMQTICLGVIDDDEPVRKACPKGEADKQLAEAREAGNVNQWNRMYVAARAAADCGGGKTARQLQLMAACKMGNAENAKPLWREFAKSKAMQQVCLGVVDDQPTTDACPDGEAEKLVAEARAAGGVNQWNRMLQKAEAAARCGSGKTARQLQLMAACKMGNKAKAKALYPEFAKISALQTLCMGVVD